MTNLSTDEEFEASGVRAQELTRANRLDEAEQLIRTIPDASRFEGWFHEKILALIQLAVKLGAKSDRKRALALLVEAEASSETLREGSTWEPADCLTRIGEALAALGPHEEAVAVFAKAGSLAAERQENDIDCAKILVRITEDLAAIGSWDEATLIAERIRPKHLRDKAVNNVRNRRRGASGGGVPD